MNNFFRLLGVASCFATAAAFAEMVETPVDDGTVDPLEFEVDFQGAYVTEGDVYRGSFKIDDFEEWNFLGRLLILPRTPVGILRLGAEYEIYDFDIPEFTQLPNKLQSAALIVGLDTKLSDSLLIRLEAKPGYYFTDDVDGRDFNVPFILGGTYLYSSTLQFVFGIGVDLESQWSVLPGGGVRWKFAPQWVLNATLPTPRLEYEVSNNFMLYLGGDLRGKNFRVDDGFIGDASEPGNLNGAVLSYMEIRAGGGLQWRLGEACKVLVEGGYVPYRQFDYHRADIRYKSEGGAPYGALSLNLSF